MRLIVTSVIIMMFFLSSCFRESPKFGITKISMLSLEAKHKGTYRFSRSDSSTYLLVEVKLINRTKREVRFISNNCSTGASIVVDTTKFEVCRNVCISNVLTTIVVEPDQEFTFPLILKTKRSGNSLSSPIRLGFILIPPYLFDGTNYSELLLKARDGYVIWSEETILYDSGQDFFDINRVY